MSERHCGVYRDYVKQAFREFLNDRIADRLQTAIDSTAGNSADLGDDTAEDAEVAVASDGIDTTEEELDGYYVVKSILRETIDVSRIFIRDVRSYCGILLDDNNRQPLCRLHFNRSVKYVSFFPEGKEEREKIGSVDDIYNYADKLKSTAAHYVSQD